jgi:hypothetical protein
MGKTKINFLDTFIENISGISYYIESKGMPQTALIFKDKVFDHISYIDFDKIDFPFCRDVDRALMGLRCIPYNKKYTIVFYQFEKEVIITEFLASKMIHW